MAESHDYLSLRGTCVYVLNMFATTSEGRAELEKFNWVSHNKNINCKFIIFILFFNYF